jgi:hypothetical protein
MIHRYYKILVVLLLLLAGCMKPDDPCGYYRYFKIDPKLNNLLFGVGSYWVYSDTSQHHIDSQYVYAAATVYHDYYKIPDPNPHTYRNYCADTLYYDHRYMRISHFQDGLYKDTLTLRTSDESYGEYTISLLWHFFLNDTSDHFSRYYSVIGTELPYIVSKGVIPILTTSSGLTFTNVFVFQHPYNSNKSIFPADADFYTVAGVGIVKIVEHRASGDVVHDLIKYHINS